MSIPSSPSWVYTRRMFAANVCRLCAVATADEKYVLPVHPPTLSFTFFPRWCAAATRRCTSAASPLDPSQPRLKSACGTANAKSIQSNRVKSTFSGGNAAAVQSG